jgi:hypothetical protein
MAVTDKDWSHGANINTTEDLVEFLQEVLTKQDICSELKKSNQTSI